MSGRELRLELAAWRCEARPDETQCWLLFGVGPATLERIERGEVEPASDVAERIALHVRQPDQQGQFTNLPWPASGRSAGLDPYAGGASRGAAGGFLGAERSDQGGGDLQRSGQGAPASRQMPSEQSGGE